MLALIYVGLFLLLGGVTIPPGVIPYAGGPFFAQYLILYILLAVLSVVFLATRGTEAGVAMTGATIVYSIASVPFGSILGPRLIMLFLVVVGGALTRHRFLLYLNLCGHLLFQMLAAGYSTPWQPVSGETKFVEISVLLATGLLGVYVFDRDLCHSRERLRTEERIVGLSGTVESLTAANLEYSTFAQLARHQALLEERNRITREIHDSIGYTLTNIIMLSEAAQSRIGEVEFSVYHNLDTIRQQAKTGLYDTRRALRVMREAEEGLPRGVDALRKLLEMYEQATGVSVDLEVLSPRNKVEDSTVFLTIYRFVQEALTNSFRHGNAREVTVRITDSGECLYVTVRDNGIGTTSVDEGIGIRGMRERVEFLGGDVTYAGDHGFVVTARLPMQQAQEPGEK